MVACTSPSLFAACHVLHRLHAPRHPPCALSSLTIKLAQNKPSCLESRTFAANLRSFASEFVVLRSHFSKSIPIQFSKIQKLLSAFMPKLQFSQTSAKTQVFQHPKPFKQSKEPNSSSSDEFPSIHSPATLSTGTPRKPRKNFTDVR